jgi:hypothetical protein
MHEIRTGAIVAFLSATLISAFMSFSASGLGAPLALIALVLYLVGMATGGSVWAMMRRGRKLSTLARLRGFRG